MTPSARATNLHPGNYRGVSVTRVECPLDETALRDHFVGRSAYFKTRFAVVQNGADVCIEAVGNPKVFEQAFFARDLAGTVVQVGVPDPQMRIDIPMIEFFGRGGRLKPSWYGDCLPSRDFPMLIDLYLQGRLDLDRFVSETIAIDQVEDAFHRMERGEVLRSVVVV